MYKLIILQVFDPLANEPDKLFVIDDDYDTSSQAELRALRWLTFRPNDIVMLLELEAGYCKHCHTPIREKEGWIRHKWIHETGNYACLPAGETQAEPV